MYDASKWAILFANYEYDRASPSASMAPSDKVSASLSVSIAPLETPNSSPSVSMAPSTRTSCFTSMTTMVAKTKQHQQRNVCGNGCNFQRNTIACI
eukprot:scaffold854_cov247-Chaetoceros_neogracile.AAC.1